MESKIGGTDWADENGESKLRHPICFILLRHIIRLVGATHCFSI